MTSDEHNKILIAALESILDSAMNHPCFDTDAFNARDIDALIKEGGDVCDWTMIGIEADRALKGDDGK